MKSGTPRSTCAILGAPPGGVKASLCLSLLALAPAAAQERPAGGAESITAAELSAHVRFFASDTFRGRGTGSPEAHRAATVIAGEYARLGLLPAGPEREFLQVFSHGPQGPKGEGGKVGRNVLALLPGSDPERRREVVIVSAHYDHLWPRTRPDGSEVLFPGADDNASGVAALLEIAEAFAGDASPPARSLLFAAWDGEEGGPPSDAPGGPLGGAALGLRGSRHFVKEPVVPLERIAAMTTMDMVSRDFLGVMEDTVYVVGAERSDALREAVEAVAPDSGLSFDHAGIDLIGPRSDHFPFALREVPVLFFSTSQHRDYHRPTDRPEKCRPGKMEAIARAVYRIVRRIADAAARPAWRAEPRAGPEELKSLVRVAGRILERRERFAMDDATAEQLRKIHADASRALETGEEVPAEKRNALKMAAGMLLFRIREKE
ncbi:MAG: M28 family peptidase [Planctomycetales bacterium]|nr:M28 family peptidase [Planctomycetales bacterium]